MGLGLFAGCGEEICKDRVLVTVKAEFREKFLAEEFSVEDFKWENVESIEYGVWYDKSSQGHLVVYLKKHGESRVKKAIKHFKTLEFVEIAEADGPASIV